MRTQLVKWGEIILYKLDLNYDMNKKLLLLTVSFAILMAACSGAVQTATPEVSESNPVEAAPATQQSSDNSATSEPIPLPTGSGEPTECTVVGLLPPLDPTQQALFPQVGEDEWTKGPEDAQVTIIDYSDFQ